MKSCFRTILAMSVGFALGGAVIQSLHAQAKPRLYYITEIEVTNPEGFAKEYLPMMLPIIKADGGRFVALGGGAGGGAMTSVEGAPPASRVAVLTWDNLAQVQAHRSSPGFLAARAVGEKYARFRSFTVEGLPN